MAERMKIRMSLEEFMARFEEQPFELFDGEIREMAPTKKQHSKVSKQIYDRILFFLAEHDLGEVFVETTYILEDRTDWVRDSRVPDVMFFEKSRYEAHEKDNPDEDGKPFYIVPDFVVEVISPTDKYTEVNQKVDAYLSDGVKLIWIVDPQRKTVSVYEGSDTPKTVREGDILTGADVLKGFEIGVDEVFG